MENNYVAQTKIKAMAPDGRTFSVRLGVGLPYEISKEVWACSVVLDGLQQRIPDMRGVDSWQALQLACQTIGQFLQYFVESGGKLYHDEGDDEELRLEDLFSKYPQR